MAKRNNQRTKFILAGAVAAAAFLVYLRALQNGFVNWDDNRYIYENPHIRSLNAAFLKWAFSAFYSVNWHPVTWISHALDYSIWGLDPMGHHLTGIILHSINTFIVVVLVVRLMEMWEIGRAEQAPPLRPEDIGCPDVGARLGAPFLSHPGIPFLAGNGKLIAAVATGLLFGLHPLHVESVVWASERKDLLCALFFLLGLLAYLKYAVSLKVRAHSEKKTRTFPSGIFTRRYLPVLILFALALMSKPMAVTFPVVLIILDWHPLGRISSFRSFRPAFAEKLPFFALSAGAAVLTVMAQHKGGAIKSLNFAPLHIRVLVAARALVLYLWKIFVPADLVPYYPYPKISSFPVFEYFLFLVSITAITIFCVMLAKRSKTWLACWGYFIITLIPVLGIVQVGKQSMADRYTYLPSLGPFLVLGIAAAWAWEKAKKSKKAKKANSFKWRRMMKIPAVAAALLAVISLSYLTYRQIGFWKNGVIFWNYIIEKEPGKVPLAYYGRGFALEQTGQTARAVADYKKTVALDPSYTDAWNNLGLIYEQRGQHDKAISFYKKAVALAPSYDVPYNNLGIAYEDIDRPDLALGAFNKSIRLKQDNPQAYFNRGNIYMETGRKGLAAADFLKACRLGDTYACRTLRTFSKKTKNIPVKNK